jgi:hypothetical protein
MAMAAAVHPTAEGLARLGELREEAYTKVLRAFTQQTFHWVRCTGACLCDGWPHPHSGPRV